MSLAVGMTSGSGGGANGVALHGEHKSLSLSLALRELKIIVFG